MKDDQTSASKDDVRLSRQSVACNAIGQPTREQRSTQYDLRARVALSARATSSRSCPRRAWPKTGKAGGLRVRGGLGIRGHTFHADRRKISKR